MEVQIVIKMTSKQLQALEAYKIEVVLDGVSECAQL